MFEARSNNDPFPHKSASRLSPPERENGPGRSPLLGGVPRDSEEAETDEGAPGDGILAPHAPQKTDSASVFFPHDGQNISTPKR